MPTYMTHFTYAREAWHNMVQHPSDREAASRKVIEAGGGRLVAFYWMLGEHDGVAIFEAPDATAAAGVTAAISSSGRVSRLQTVHLLTSEEARASLELAKVVAGSYEPPGGHLSQWRAGYEEAL